jgi:hypothetical protein
LTERFIKSIDGDPTGDGDAYPGRVVGLRTIKEGLRRYRLIWASSALLGLLIGASFHLIIPNKYVAVTTLYLTEPTGGPAYTVSDDVNLLETDTVAYRALRILHLSNINNLPGSYQGSALGDALLEMKADGGTPAKAVRWAKALAAAFLSVRAKTLGAQTQLVVSTMETQVKHLEVTVQDLNNTINVLSSSGGGPGTANQIAQMVSERGTDETQLTNLQNSIQEDLLQQASLDKGSYVLDPPRVLLVHTKRIFAEDGLSGLVAGLAIGIGGVVVAAIISDRPRRRAEVAALLGAPVELSIRGLAEPTWMSLTSPRGYVKRPGTQLELSQRRLKQRLGQLGHSALAVVGAGRGTTGTAAAVLAGAALSLAADGKQVAVVDLCEGRPLARLFRAKGDGARTVTFRHLQLRLAVAPEDLTSLDPREVAKGADAVLVLANADPAVGVEHLRPWAEAAVVMLRAGKASDLLIEATGQMLREAGVAPMSAFLLGADREDETFGSEEYASYSSTNGARRNGQRYSNWVPTTTTSHSR